MAYIYKLILLSFISLWSAFSFASVPQITQVQSACPYTGGGVSGKYDSVQSLCSSGWAESCAKAWDPTAFTKMQSSGSYAGMCTFVVPSGGQEVIGGAFTISNVLSCPSNSTLVGGSCECNEGFVEDGGQCKPVNPCPSGQHEEFGVCVPDDCQPDEVRVNGQCVKEPPCPEGETRIDGVCKKSNKCEAGRERGMRDIGDSQSWYFCEAGCELLVVASFDMTYEKDGKRITENYGMAKETGRECTGGSSQPGDGNGGGEPGDGGGSGDGGGNDGGSGGTGGTGGSGGSGGGTGGSGGSGGGTGGTGGDPGTGNLGGSTDSGGTDGKGQESGVGGNEPIGQDKPPEGCEEGFVERNGKCYETREKEPDGDGKCPQGYVKVNTSCVPLVPTEGGGNGDGGGGDGSQSAFGGTCMAGFRCEGDAIQCAIAREQHRRNCALFVDKSDESLLYDENKGKQGNQTNDLPGNETVSLSGRIDTSDALGGGSCIPDLNVTVMGQSISLPFSQICNSLAMLGNLLVAISMLLAARIIMRG